MKLRILVGSLLVWGSLLGCSMPGWAMSDCSKLGRTMSGCSMSGRTMLGRTMSGWGTLALSGARSSCASGPSLEHLKKIEESPSFEHSKKIEESPSLEHSKKIEESPSLEHSKKIEESPSSQERKSDKKADAEQLARALDYFSSEKFHECLILLQPLNRRYKLNPRYRAYLAVCLYYEWEYDEAVKLFDEVIPLLQGLAPHELSLYYWMEAESYFALQQYDRALPLYGKMLPICWDNEKPDAYYRMGFCHLFAAEASGASSSEKVSGSSESSGASEKASGSSESSGSSAEERKKAKECFELSLEGYLKYRNTPNEQARIAQIRHMIGGLK